MRPTAARALFADQRLYPIVNVHSASPVEALRAKSLACDLADAGIDWMQLRAKPLAAGAMAELASAIVEELTRRSSRLIVNDRVDVAMAAGAAGVHLGDEDLPVAVARRLMGEHAVIGYSTHDPDATRLASELPLDYIAFGPVFDSPTKAGVRTARGLELLTRACSDLQIPVIAIGGITIDSAPEVWRAGASAVAVISEVERSAARGDLGGLLRSYGQEAERLA